MSSRVCRSLAERNSKQADLKDLMLPLIHTERGRSDDLPHQWIPTDSQGGEQVETEVILRRARIVWEEKLSIRCVPVDCLLTSCMLVRSLAAKFAES